MKLTKKRAIKLHRELWDWLFHHPSKKKWDWPRWTRNGGDISVIENDCFLCEYDKFRKDDCMACPLDWGGRNCNDDNAYFNLWNKAKLLGTRKKYAKIIRDLPERKRR